MRDLKVIDRPQTRTKVIGTLWWQIVRGIDGRRIFRKEWL